MHIANKKKHYYDAISLSFALCNLEIVCIYSFYSMSVDLLPVSWKLA